MGGWFASFLDKTKNTYYGVEITSLRTKIAKEKGLMVVRQDLDKGLPFKDKCFDVVVASEILEHLPNVSMVLLEIRRVLKDDGIFVGSVPNLFNVSELFSTLRMHLSPKFSGHLTPFTRCNLISLFKLNGFTITRLTGDSVLPPTKHTLPLSAWLGEKLGPFSKSILFKAVKTP